VAQEPETFVEQATIAPPDNAKIFDSAAWGTPIARTADIFKKKAARLETVRSFYEPLCEQCVMINIKKAAKHGKLLCNGAWDKLSIAIRGAYQDMIGYLKELHRARQEKVYKMQEGVKGEAAFLKEKIRESQKL